VRTGSVLLPRGLQLRPQDVALAAGQGIAALEVVRPAASGGGLDRR
jgi:molybdopterin biosynthesis enzyme